MSSLSRRACYKCGNVGHYAEVCSSSERLCYNCKQPGGSTFNELRLVSEKCILTDRFFSGHESNNCPSPRTTESKLTSTTLSVNVE